MKHAMKAVVAIVVTASLSGCLATNQTLSDPSHRLAHADRDGLVVASIRLEDACSERYPYTFYLFPATFAGSRDEWSFPLDAKERIDLRSDGTLFVFARQLNAGKYEIRSFAYGRKNPFLFSKVIHVEPGKTYYLGRISLKIADNCDNFSASMSDEYSVDVTAFQKRYKELHGKMVQKQLISFIRPKWNPPRLVETPGVPK